MSIAEPAREKDTVGAGSGGRFGTGSGGALAGGGGGTETSGRGGAGGTAPPFPAGAGGALPGAGGTGGADAGDDAASTCAPCALPHVAAQGCVVRACAVIACEPNWVDCDGVASNGCEAYFGPAGGGSGDAGTVNTVHASRLTPVMDGDGQEWSGIPPSPIARTCAACSPTQPGGQPGELIVGSPLEGDQDLRATFRLTWDDLSLYLFVQVRDDRIVAWEPGRPERQDGVELFVDGGHHGLPGYGPDDHHVFVGAIGGTAFEKNQEAVPSTTDVLVKTRVQASCYVVEARLTWFYLMGRIPHVPAIGNTYGWTVAVNDWEASADAEAGAAPARQNQLFWAVPTPQYSFDTLQFGDLILE